MSLFTLALASFSAFAGEGRVCTGQGEDQTCRAVVFSDDAPAPKSTDKTVTVEHVVGSGENAKTEKRVLREQDVKPKPYERHGNEK
jgi:hypothetical protein